MQWIEWTLQKHDSPVAQYMRGDKIPEWIKERLDIGRDDEYVPKRMPFSPDTMAQWKMRQRQRLYKLHEPDTTPQKELTDAMDATRHTPSRT